MHTTTKLYSFVKKNRTKGQGGGFGVDISDRLKWKRRINLEHDKLECIFIEIFPKKEESFLISTIYRPPDSSKYLPTNFKHLFDDMLSKIENKELILMAGVEIRDFSVAGHFCKNLLAFFLRNIAGGP